MPEREQEQEATWIDRVCIWLARETKQTGQLCWIVLDGFRNTLVGQGTHDLVFRLAHMTLGDSATWRLVLIGYRWRTELESLLAVTVDHEDLDIEELRRECQVKIAEGIGALYVERQRQQGRAIEQTEVNDSLLRVLKQVTASHPSWMRVLGQALGDEARRVFAPAAPPTPAGGGGGG